MSLGTLALNQVTGSLKRYGCRVVVTHISKCSGPDGSSDTTQTVITSGAMDASSASGLGYKFGQGLVQGGDHKLTLPGNVAVSTGDTLQALGSIWKVISIQPVYVGDVQVSQDLLVRR